MTQIHLLLGGAVLFTFGLRVFTMPLEELSVEEIALKFDNSSSTNDPEDGLYSFNDCYLQKNESGVITTINKTREEVGNDTYIGYEEICEESLPLLSISAGALASLAGK